MVKEVVSTWTKCKLVLDARSKNFVTEDHLGAVSRFWSPRELGRESLSKQSEGDYKEQKGRPNGRDTAWGTGNASWGDFVDTTIPRQDTFRVTHPPSPP